MLKRVRTLRVAAMALTLAAGSIGALESQVDAQSTVERANAPVVSGDGNWAVFGGLSDDGRQTVFRSNLITGEVQELSTIPDEVRRGDTVDPAISADGCVVAAITEAPFDLFRDDDRGNRWDVYRLVVPECGGELGAWELVSASSDGTALDHAVPGDRPAVSGSGADIAYVHTTSSFDDNITMISVVDLTVPPSEPGRLTRIDGVPAEVPNRTYVYSGASQPAISQNGRHVAFTADFTASALLPGWADGPEAGEAATTQVYVWDREPTDPDRPVILVSDADGPAAAGASAPSVSADGRFIAFQSAERSLTQAILPSCQPECRTQIYRIDRDADGNGIFDQDSPTINLISAVDVGHTRLALPEAGDGHSRMPAINADGSQIAFVTDATNLLPSVRGGGGTRYDGDLVVAEVHLGEIRRALSGRDTSSVPGAHASPSISNAGGTIVFETAAGAALPSEYRVAADGIRTIAFTTSEPRLSLAELDFGSVRPGYESDELFVSVQNAGPGAFEPGNISIDSSAFSVTGGSCQAGIIVAAGETCTVNVMFSPSSTRGYEATLSISDLGSGEPAVSTTLRGAAGDPTFRATPGGVDLDPGVVGSEADRMAIDILNIGYVPVEMGEVTITGKNPDDFVITDQVCTDRALNPDASCAVEVAFVPTDAGFRSALVLVSSAAGQYTAALLGGYAQYDPTFEVTTDDVEPGTVFEVAGHGYPADSEVGIGFDDGSAPFGTVTTDDTGAFRSEVLLPDRVRPNDYRIVAAAEGDAVAAATMTIAPASRRAATPLPGLGLG